MIMSNSCSRFVRTMTLEKGHGKTVNVNRNIVIEARNILVFFLFSVFRVLCRSVFYVESLTLCVSTFETVSWCGVLSARNAHERGQTDKV